MSNRWMAGVMSTALAAAMAGCGSVPTTPQATTQAAPAPAAPDRHVAAADEITNFDQVATQLPTRISVQDADRMLVSVDPSQVQADHGYSVQVVRGLGMGVGARGLGLGRRVGVGAFGGYTGLRRMRFFRYRNFYVPYSLGAYGYSPYLYSSYLPYLYSYGNTYTPYCSPGVASGYGLGLGGLYPYAVTGYGHPFAMYSNGVRPWVYYNTPRW